MDFLLAAWNISNGRLRWISLALAVSAGALAYSLGERGSWMATLVLVPWLLPSLFKGFISTCYDRRCWRKSRVITPHLKLAFDYRQSGQYDLAIAEYDAVISIDRYFGKAGVYTLRGDLYCLKGQYDLAISDYTAAINIAPKLIGLGPLSDDRDPKRVENVLNDAYCGRGLALHAEEEYGMAIVDFDDAAHFFLTSDYTKRPFYSHCYRGLVYYSKGEYDLAIADFETAIHLSPAEPIRDAERPKSNCTTSRSEYRRSVGGAAPGRD